MKKIIICTIKLVDCIFSQAYLRFFQEKNSLITFLFHALFRNEKEISLNVGHPQEGITIRQFSQFIEYYLNHRYIFISPNDILSGLNNDKKYVLISFDDGYFNNKYSLPILKEYGIPAVFFIAANHVKYNRCFWWDVLYRKRIKLGTSVKDISREQQQLMSKTNEEIERYIKDLFGEKAFKPICDIDRPFTPSELKDFSKEKYVFLGNHTSDHAILTNYSPTGIKSQILSAQNTIYDITGIKPIIISYPIGDYSNEVIRISKEIGLKLGITVDSKKNYLPIDFQGNGSMHLGRFVLGGNNDLIKQCEMFRSDIVLYDTVIGLHRSVKNLIKRSC